MLLSYCVVNTNDRKHLLACLDAIDETVPPGLEHEILVLDNASEDGSADARRSRGDGIRLIELDRAGKAANDSHLLREAKGEFCLLLNEDSELRPGAVDALLAALRADLGRRRPVRSCSPDGRRVPCAWRLPVRTALAGALFLHRRHTVQSGGTETRAVGWVQSSAMLVRRSAAEGRLARPAVLRLLG